jgi:NAD-dependent deacetylase
MDRRSSIVHRRSSTDDGRQTTVDRRWTMDDGRWTMSPSQSEAFGMEEHELDALAARLSADVRITVLTGAGVSAASGVPTFRGPEGLWRQFRPEQLATPEAFARDPRLAWEWYDWRRRQLVTCRPNRGHEVLAAWSRRFRNFTLITQNVDGLHERAGTRHVLRMHGSIWEVKCWARCDASPVRWADENVPLSEIPPRCAYCGGLLRPGVVWFGEALDPEIMRTCLQATRCDIFFAVGTSAVVYPAASFLREARSSGACTVEINLEATPASGFVDFALQGPAEKILDELDSRLWW